MSRAPSTPYRPAALAAIARHRAIRVHARTSVDAQRRHATPAERRRHGLLGPGPLTLYRLGCDRCGAVRWLPQEEVGTSHCYRGTFLYLLKEA